MRVDCAQKGIANPRFKASGLQIRWNGDPNVYAKSTLDVVMVGVGFLGPVGFGISAVYFIVDLSTDGFYGWGAIPDNYKESKP